MTQISPQIRRRSDAVGMGSSDVGAHLFALQPQIGGSGWEWNAFTYALVALLGICVLIVVLNKLLDIRDARRVKADLDSSL
ncbi:hypothetical protein FOS14_01600 [Skermania sp. ID1734]|nr:hypothetical protein FOS14_01600 [Skermania sp. ID1734]